MVPRIQGTDGHHHKHVRYVYHNSLFMLIVEQQVFYSVTVPTYLVFTSKKFDFVTEIFRKVLIRTIVCWAEESQIETPKLVREMFR